MNHRIYAIIFTNHMKTYQFLELLQNNPNKSLLFAYQKEKLVAPNYHITEVKNVEFKTTDCGGKQNHWQETHLQLWEKPSEKHKTIYMTTNKAVSILNTVNAVNPLWLKTEIKIEYGNDNFHTAILKISDFTQTDKTLTFKLFEEKTQCKANQTCC